MSKKQWKTIDLSLNFSIKTDWSQEEVDSPLSDVNAIRSSLPTKMNATRQTAELDNISENGPFILNFANMSFDATETDLRQFFRAYEIYALEMNPSRRGCGYIEFTNIKDLTGAWSMNEKIFINRPLRLSIPLKDDIARQQAMDSRQKFQPQQKQSTFNIDDSDNWRAKKPQPVTQRESPTAANIDDSTNWRIKAAREPEVTSAPESTIENANWRNRASKIDNAPSAGVEQSAWTRKPARAAEVAVATDGGAWSRRVPRDESNQVAAKVADGEVWRRGREATAPKEAVSRPLEVQRPVVEVDTKTWTRAPRQAAAPAVAMATDTRDDILTANVWRRGPPRAV